MAETTTTPDNVTPEAVSGWSIFWALVAIVSHAMLQVSFTGYAWTGNSFQGSLWPYRSSPFICLVDGVADGYLCLRALLIRGPNDRKQELNSGRNGALTRLALFTFGVLPQAIKLFAMRGIPVTQAIAAMYLLPSVLGLVRSLISNPPERDIQNLLRTWNGSLGPGLPKIILAICGWIPHLVGTCAFYHHLVDRIGLSASDNIVNAVDWLVTLLVFVFILYLGQNMIFALFNKRSPIPCYPILLILAYTDVCGLPDIVSVPGQRLKKGTKARWHITIQHLVSLCLGCYLCAALFYYLKGWIYSRYSASVSSESLATINRSETPVSHEAAATQTAAQGLSRAPGSDCPPNNDVEPLQQPPAVHHQALHSTDNGGVAGNTTGLGPSVIASNASTVPEAAQSDELRTIAPSWLQRAWEYLQYGLLLLAMSPFLAVVIIRLYLFEDERDESANVAKEQTAAEEGAVNTSAGDRDKHGQAQDMSSPPRSMSQELYCHGQTGIRALGVIFRWILRMSWTLIWRLVFVGISSIFLYSMEWVRRHATEIYPIEILVNAFGLVNFSMAVLYYLVFFDGEGTSAPAWADILG